VLFRPLFIILVKNLLLLLLRRPTWYLPQHVPLRTLPNIILYHPRLIVNNSTKYTQPFSASSWSFPSINAFNSKHCDIFHPIVTFTPPPPPWCMPSPINPSPAYLRVLQVEHIEEAQAELYEAQTWLLENGASLCILANQTTASTYLSNHHLALVEILRITSHLSAAVQALLYSVAKPTLPPTP